MRCFIAVDIDKESRKALGNLQKQLQDRTGVKKGDARWVKPDDVHLTLKFLGEVEDAKIVEVCDIVKEVAGLHKSFDLAIESLGCFGGKRPSVLWVGAGAGSDEMSGLQKDIEHRLSLVSFPPEAREFSSHLTLCRIKDSRAGAKLAAVCNEYKDFKLGVVLIDSVKVYQSQLTPSGPVYTLLGNYKLQ